MMTETEYGNAVANLKVDDNVKAKLLEAHKKHPEMASHAVGMVVSAQKGDPKGVVKHSADLQASAKKHVNKILKDKHEVGERATHQLVYDFLNFFKFIIELLEELFDKMKNAFENMLNKAPGVKQAENLFKTIEHAMDDLKKSFGTLEHWATHPVQTAEDAGSAILHGAEHLMGINTDDNNNNNHVPEPPGTPPGAPRPG